VTVWHGTITWTLESKKFSVYDSATGGNLLLDPYTKPQGIVTPGIYTFDFYLQNDGTVSITIQISNPSGSGATPSWNSPNWIVNVGTTRVPATLTLGISATGSYSWEFTIA